MTVQLNVSGDLKKINKRIDTIKNKKVVARATASALNKTRKQSETLAIRSLAKMMGIKSKDLRSGMFQIKANARHLVTEVTFRGRPFNLIRFGAKQTKKGVSAKVFGKRKFIKSAWIGNQGRTVFIRKTKERDSIRGFWGPSIPAVLVTAEINKAMRVLAKMKYPQTYHHELKFYLDRAK